MLLHGPELGGFPSLAVTSRNLENFFSSQMSDGFSRLVKLAALRDHGYAKFQYLAQEIGDFGMLQDAVERRRSATRF